VEDGTPSEVLPMTNRLTVSRTGETGVLWAVSEIKKEIPAKIGRRTWFGMIPIRDTVPRTNPPIATWLIILANCLVFLFELTMPEPVLVDFFYRFGLVSARYTHPAWALSVGLPVDDYFPLLTSMFIHGGWMHIIGNMWALWIFGDNVEDRMGPVRVLGFYLSCGLAAGLVQLYINPHSTIPTVGASGAIAGVMGAYLLLFPFARIVVLLPLLFIPLFFELPAVTYLGFWALTQVFSGTLSLAAPADVGVIAWWGHVGGFCAGMLLLPLFLKRGGAYRRLARDEYGIENAWLPAGYWEG
jgi:membrane associated rhomboid family serine protease